MARATRQSAPSTSSQTLTLTLENFPSSSSSQQNYQSNQQQPQEETLVLELKPKKKPKKKVTWREDTVDNEFLNKKSSKICCIFHKEKPFDQDDSDDEDDGNFPKDQGHNGNCHHNHHSCADNGAGTSH